MKNAQFSTIFSGKFPMILKVEGGKCFAAYLYGTQASYCLSQGAYFDTACKRNILSVAFKLQCTAVPYFWTQHTLSRNLFLFISFFHSRPCRGGRQRKRRKPENESGQQFPWKSAQGEREKDTWTDAKVKVASFPPPPPPPPPPPFPPPPPRDDSCELRRLQCPPLLSLFPFLSWHFFPEDIQRIFLLFEKEDTLLFYS